MKLLRGITLPLLSSLLLFSLSSSALERREEGEETRLISLEENSQVWMTEREIMDLVEKNIPFVDVTDGVWDWLASNSLSSSASFSGEGDRALGFPSKSFQKPLITKIIKAIDTSFLKSFLDQFTAFNNRYYTSATGLQSAEFLFNELTNLQERVARERPDLSLNVTKFQHSWQQFSVIASLSPSSPPDSSSLPLPGSRIVLGAHQDSVNSRNPSNGRAPGYDDDGTGCANNLATLRLFIEEKSFVPGRPIEFHFYAAEEVGLRGSQNIAQQYRTDKKEVYGMLNSDMTGYPSNNPVYAIVTDNADPSLTSFLRLLAREYSSLPVVDTRCGYACSDHASWNRLGVPVAHHHEATIETDNPKIHSTDDVGEILSLNHAAEFLKTTIAFAVELSLYQG